MQAEYLNRRKKHMEQVAASSTGISGIRKRGIYMRNMTFGGFLAGLCTIIGLLCFIGAVSDAAEPKCIVTGCSNKRAPESSYCYLHKPYRRSYTSSYSSGSSGSSSSSSYGKSSGSSSAASRSSSSYSKPKSSYGTSSYRKSTADSYDDGYDDVYMDGDYDDDRYARDSDYADGVDDALDELGDD